MSNSGHFSDGRRQEKGPEESNFLLSQFMKGKGKITDLNLEIGGKIESVENVGVLVKSLSNQTDFSTKQQPPVDSSTNIVEFSSNKACTSKDAAKADPKTAQLTIFYDGKVLVFDDYPTNRARELVSLAKKGSSKMSYGILSNTFHENTSNSTVGASTSSPRQGLPHRPRMSTISEKHVGISSNNCKEITNSSATEAVATSSRSEERLSPPPEANDSGDISPPKVPFEGTRPPVHFVRNAICDFLPSRRPFEKATKPSLPWTPCTSRPPTPPRSQRVFKTRLD